MGQFDSVLGEYADWIDQAARYLRESWGLNKDFARRAADLILLFKLYGIFQAITSGYRSPEKQAELRTRAARGEPGIYSPAKNSKHTHVNFLGGADSLAIDVATSNWAGAAWIAHELGIRTGYEFGDGVHFSD